ncbi:MAG: cation:proton antiporter [Defluviitaleaceae bacterium]|nr:cation:proton antiporter [Defluviitaleaceae bacterium]
MLTIEIILIMLALVFLSYIVHVFFRKISMPLVQIALGTAAAFLPISFEIETEIFMLVFIAPILFADGQKFKIRELNALKKPLLLLVIGLVLVNTVVGGFLIYFLISEIPLGISFALAAVLSPTDAVTVKAITDKLHLPEKIKSLIEGESLFNDASGLVAYNFALIAAISGIFNIGDVAAGFAFVALGGIAAGAAGAATVHFLMKFLKRINIEELNIYTLLQIITPFLVFIFSERIGVSGILAVVVCGIIHKRLAPRLMDADEAQIRFSSEGTWEVMVFILNGLVFIMLGMLVSDIFMGATTSDFNPLMGLAYVAAVTLIFWIIRFMYSFFLVGSKNALTLAFAGVRGALTLAVCLAIPLTIATGEAFPARDLVLFISSGVIVLTIIIANIALPKIAQEATPTENDALKKVTASAIKLIQAEGQNDETSALLLSYFEYLQSGEATLNIKETSGKSLKAVLGLEHNNIKSLLSMKIYDKYHLEFIAIQIQKHQIETLVTSGEIDISTAYHLRRTLSLEEAALFEDDLDSQE